MSIEAKVKAAELALRMLATAVKTCVLYTASHQVTRRAIETLLGILRSYVDTYGPLSARVVRSGFYVDGFPLRGTAMANLAAHLYTRRIVYFRIFPTVDARALEEVVPILAMERGALEAAGGARTLVQQAGAASIQLDEMALEEDQELQAIDMGALVEILGSREPSLNDRERLIEILRAGPERTCRLLEDATQAVVEIPEGDEQARVDRVLDMLRNLDRLVLDQAFEDQPRLYAHLAEAWSLAREPLRSLLTRAVQRDEVLVERLTGSPLRAHRRLTAREAAGTVQVGGGAEDRLGDLLVLDEHAVNREVIQTLVDLLAQDADDGDLADGVEMLGGYLPWLVEQREFRLLAQVLARFNVLGAVSDSASGRVAAAHLQRFAAGPQFEALSAALWDARGTPVEGEVLACLGLLGAQVIGRLVAALAAERRGGMRAMLRDVLIAVGADHLDALGAGLDDQRWYVVRNVARILGGLRRPEGVAHLARLIQHPDHRVRREVIDALAAIGTDEAQQALVRFLDDPDERLVSRALSVLDPTQVMLALPRLMGWLEQPDPLGRHLELKRAVLEALADLAEAQPPGSLDAVWLSGTVLPAIQRLARTWALPGARADDLRALAGTVVEAIAARAGPSEDHLPPQARPSPT